MWRSLDLIFLEMDKPGILKQGKDVISSSFSFTKITSGTIEEGLEGKSLKVGRPVRLS